MKPHATILIADDVLLNRAMLEDIFCEDDAACSILQAADGQQAISALDQHSQDIALVLLDLTMPRKNGFEVLQHMRDTGLEGRIPVIVITGSDEYQDEVCAYNLGAADVIHKPFVPEIVLRRAQSTRELYESRAEIQRQLDIRTRELEVVQTHDPLTGLHSMQHFFTVARGRCPG